MAGNKFSSLCMTRGSFIILLWEISHFLQGLCEASNFSWWLSANDRQKAQEHNEMIYHNLNCLFFLLVSCHRKVCTCLHIFGEKGSKYSSKYCSSTYSQGKYSKQSTTTGISPLWELFASQEPKGMYIAISWAAIILQISTSKSFCTHTCFHNCKVSRLKS